MNPNRKPLGKFIALLSISLALGIAGCNQKAETTASAQTAVPASPNTTEPQTVAAGSNEQQTAAPAIQPLQSAEADAPKTTESKTAQKKQTAEQHSHDAVAEKTKATEKRKTAEPAKPAACADCGTISAINTVEKEGEGSGLGAIAGGVAGAVLGHQVGGGTGKDIATIAGAAGGAYAGHQIEKKMKKTVGYEVSVKMEDGGTRTLSYKEKPAFAVGDKVKIVDGRLESR